MQLVIVYTQHHNSPIALYDCMHLQMVEKCQANVYCGQYMKNERDEPIYLRKSKQKREKISIH